MHTTDPRTPIRRARQRGGWTLRQLYDATRAADPTWVLGPHVLYLIDAGTRPASPAERAAIRAGLAALAAARRSPPIAP